jgi:exopolysaccharide biosynthesis polyprenyl glycosylphosphotransferase
VSNATRLQAGHPPRGLAAAATLTPAPAVLTEPLEALEAPLAHVRHARMLLVAGDVFELVVASMLGVRVWGWILGSAAPAGTTRPSVWVPFVPITLAMMAVYGLYRRPGRRVRSLTFLDLGHLFHAVIVSGLLTLAASGSLHRLVGTPKLTWSEVAACALPAMLGLPAMRAALTAVMDQQNIARTRVIIVGSGTTALRVAGRLGRFGDIELVGWVAPDTSAVGTPALGEHLGSGEQLPALCRSRRVDRVLVALDDRGGRPDVDWFRDLPPAVRVSVVPPFSDVLTCRSNVDELHGLAVIDVAPPAAGIGQRAAKRSLDIVVSGGLLLISLPAIAMIALVIKRGSRGPVFFRQVRAGRGNKPFVVYKFRTMRDGAEEKAAALRPFSDMDGPIFKLRDDPRVTRAGRFLRRFSLDELPQLFNVLKGDMSLVGPRPFPMDEAAKIDGWAGRRFDARPGMTGYWQVSGRNDLTFEELQQLDYAYVASWSLWWDLKILWQTPGAVLAQRGAY